MRWAFGSSTPVKETFGPRDVVGKAAFMIARENGMGHALSGTGGARFSVARSPTCCRSLCSCSLDLHNSALSAREAATSAWRARIVSKIYCVVTLSPQEDTLPADPTAACLVVLILSLKTLIVTVSGTLF